METIVVICNNKTGIYQVNASLSSFWCKTWPTKRNLSRLILMKAQRERERENTGRIKTLVWRIEKNNHRKNNQ